MNFSASVIPFIKGKEFSSDLSVELSVPGKIIERQNLIDSLIKGKRIVHLGFADHLEIIPDRIKSGTWLHAHIEKITSECIGVDINEKSVDFLVKNYNVRNVYVHDVTASEKLARITEQQWDYILLGEVLEHINNPVEFLRRIRENYGKHIDKMIITVPNAYSLIELKSIWNNKERINSDHRFWFTPYTLAKVVTEAGLQVESFELCNAYVRHNFIERFFIKRKPLLNHCVVMTVTF